jgi:hypothetical protein
MWRGVLIAVLLIVVLGRARCEADKKVTNVVNQRGACELSFMNNKSIGILYE